MAVNICRLDEKTEAFQHQHYKCFYMLRLWAKRNLFKACGVKGRFTVVSDLESHSHTKWRNSGRSWHPQWQRHWEPQKPSHQSLATCQTVSLLSDALTLQEREREQKLMRLNQYLKPGLEFFWRFAEPLFHNPITTGTMPSSWSMLMVNPHTHTHQSMKQTVAQSVADEDQTPMYRALLTTALFYALGCRSTVEKRRRTEQNFLNWANPWQWIKPFQ